MARPDRQGWWLRGHSLLRKENGAVLRVVQADGRLPGVAMCECGFRFPLEATTYEAERLHRDHKRRILGLEPR